MNCYTIPASAHFMRTLAGWVLSEYGDAPEALTKTTILLPGRRACRSLREIFLDMKQGKPMLLPRIQPIGDTEAEAYGFLGLTDDTPPPMQGLRRQLWLMQLVSAFERRRQGRIYNMEKTAQLAAQLAALIDEMDREEVGFEGLGKLAPHEFSVHWQQTLDFLHIISQQWPRVLESENSCNPVYYRNRILTELAARLKHNPPDYPIIAAGSTGSQPATAKLLGAIAGLPQGRVVLPGLDKEMPRQEWEMLGETHPQFMLKQLLAKLECPRERVATLGGEADAAREACLAEIFKPSAATANWPSSRTHFTEGLAGVHMLEADTLSDEARSIAILLREILEMPGKTAAVVTPDRALARMVSAQMQRFGVKVDDSAGRSLKQTPTGIFLRMVAEMAASQFAPAELLAVLRHPLAAAWRRPGQCRYYSTVLERFYLRGVRKDVGLNSLIQTASEKGDAELAAMLSGMESAWQPLMDCFGKKTVPFTELLQAHIQAAEWLATTEDEPGQERLWAKEAGNHMAAWLSDLMEQADLLPEMDPHIYPATLDALMGMESYWPQQAMHPRLHILSPIEARLLQYDRVILSGLNEGSWPEQAQADPWMSRPMRAAFGLTSPERGVGQAAHDVAMLACAPEVWLTRARKVDGVPTVASRWLVRIETLVGAKSREVFARMTDSAWHHAALLALDAPVDLPDLTQPAPAPPLHARPSRLRVTDVDIWLRDPYIIYARHILKLKPLEPLDREPNAADFGTLTHKALELFVRRWPVALPNDALTQLLRCGQEAFETFLKSPAVKCLWWPRFESLATWLIAQETERRAHLIKIMAELEGIWTLDVDGSPFTLTTRIDRLELAKDGSATVIDYKTGSMPTDAERKKGLGNQLPLEALIVQNGSLSQPVDMANHTPSLQYWRLAAKQSDCGIKTVAASADDLQACKAMLAALIGAYRNPDQAYTAQSDVKLQARYNDYEHLARVKEWESV